MIRNVREEEEEEEGGGVLIRSGDAQRQYASKICEIFH